MSELKMETSNTYIPCLRWKQGEYIAIRNLSENSKKNILPLIEIPEMGFDFEKQEDIKTIDKHVKFFAKRIKDNWGTDFCFVDTHFIDHYSSLGTGQHPLEFIYNDLRSKNVLAIPVIGLNEANNKNQIISEVISQDKRGVSFRVKIEDVVTQNFQTKIEGLLKKLGLSYKDCDLLLDLKAPNYKPINNFASLLAEVISAIPGLKLWREFGILSTSFPKSFGQFKQGLSTIPRNEWRLYKNLITLLHKSYGVRLPRFGDYGITYPEPAYLDMRLIKPYASIKYSINEGWLISKGRNVRDYRFTQFRELCSEIVNSEYYFGREFSYGDEYLYSCANGDASTGNLTTWHKVGTNHHLEVAVRDVANFSYS